MCGKCDFAKNVFVEQVHFLYIISLMSYSIKRTFGDIIMLMPSQFMKLKIRYA